MEDANPLDKLFADGGSLDLELLANLLVDYVRLYATGEIGFTEEGRSLTAKEKIAIFLLARKALKQKGIITDEAIKPGDIEEQTGIKGNTIRPLLKQLKDERIARNDDGGAYHIPDFAIHAVDAMLKKGAK